MPASSPDPVGGRSIASVLFHSFRWIVAGITIGLLLTIVRVFAQFVVIEPRLVRYERASRALHGVHEGMLDQETSLRGYLFTRAPSFLEPCERGNIATTSQMDVLLDALGSEEGMLHSVLRLRLAVDAWQRNWADAARGRAVGPGADDAFLTEGKRLFDVYRSAELNVDAGLVARREATAEQERRLIAWASALQLFVYVVLAVLVLVQFRRIRRGIEAPVRQLLVGLEGVAAGEIEAPPLHTDIAEMRRLGDGLAATARALSTEREAREAREVEAKTLAARLRRLLEVARELNESLNLRYVLDAVASAAGAIVSHDRLIVWIIDDDTKELNAAFDTARAPTEGKAPDSGVPSTRNASSLPPLPLGGGLAGRAAKSARTVVVSVPSSAPEGHDVVCLPLIVGARVIGVLELRVARGSIGPQELELLELLASHAGTAIESARLHAIAEELSHKDALTRLFNRRRLDEDLASECRRSARYRRPLSVALLDVDHFKKLNDTFGHGEGDAVLQHVADVVARAVRATDAVFRYGGEEFVILMRETGMVAALATAERVRLAVERECGDPSRQLMVTISVGVADLDPANPTPRSVLETADRALYRAKHEGRNRVVGGAPLDSGPHA